MIIDKGVIGDGVYQGDGGSAAGECHRVGTLDNPAFDTAAWHRHGVIIPEGMSFDDGMELALMNWRTELEPVFLPGTAGADNLTDEQIGKYLSGIIAARSSVQELRQVFADIGRACGTSWHPIPDAFATVRDDLPRDDIRRALGIVGGRYEPIQNVEAMALAEAIVGEGNAKIDSIGTLRNGRTVWCCLELPSKSEIRGNGLTDEIAHYLVCSTSHDGTSALKVVATDVATRCWNTLQAGIHGARSRWSVIHRKNARANIAEARNVLSQSKEHFEKSAQRLQAFADQPVSELFVRLYLETMFPAPKPKEDGKPVSDGHAIGKRSKVWELFCDTQQGAHHPALKGTAYGLLNATTEFIDYQRPTRTAKGRTAIEARLDSIWNGSGAKEREKAVHLLEECVIGVDGKETLVQKAERVGRESLANAWDEGQKTKAVDDLLAGIAI